MVTVLRAEGQKKRVKVQGVPGLSGQDLLAHGLLYPRPVREPGQRGRQTGVGPRPEEWMGQVGKGL